MSLPKKFLDSIPFSEKEKLKLIYGLENEPVISIRNNPFKDNNLFETAEKVVWSKYGKYLEERPYFIKDPLFHAGTYYSQEASSMFLEVILESLNLSRCVVLDLCAAPWREVYSN